MNTLHAQVQRLDRGIDKIAPEMKDLGQEQDGSEIKSRELELLTDRVRKLGDRRDAFEAMRDLAAKDTAPRPATPGVRATDRTAARPAKLTSAAIDARDYLRARNNRETSAHLPEGTLVAFTGGKDFGDVTAIWHSLDSIKIKYDDMVLLHGGGPGAEKIAASWGREERRSPGSYANRIGDRDGKAAPFRRNDVLLNFLPKGLIAFPVLASPTISSTRHARSEFPYLSPPRSDTLQGRPPPSHSGGRPPFCAGWLEKQTHGGALRATANRASLRSLAARRSSNDASPPHGTALRAIAVRRALKRHASARPSPVATALSASRKPPRRTAVLRTPLPCFANSHAPSFGLERITAFFRHHGPGGLGNLPSRQYALVQKGPQTALRDIDAARFQHFMHLSHRHPFGLLHDQPLP